MVSRNGQSLRGSREGRRIDRAVRTRDREVGAAPCRDVPPVDRPSPDGFVHGVDSRRRGLTLHDGSQDRYIGMDEIPRSFGRPARPFAEHERPRTAEATPRRGVAPKSKGGSRPDYLMGAIGPVRELA